MKKCSQLNKNFKSELLEWDRTRCNTNRYFDIWNSEMLQISLSIGKWLDQHFAKPCCTKKKKKNLKKTKKTNVMFVPKPTSKWYEQLIKFVSLRNRKETLQTWLKSSKLMIWRQSWRIITRSLKENKIMSKYLRRTFCYQKECREQTEFEAEYSNFDTKWFDTNRFRRVKIFFL